MKNKFFEYYILSDEERIKRIWDDAIIVLDTNVLFNLYRYSEDSKDNLLGVLEFYEERLWIPYQVGLEYHRDRVTVYMDLNAAYNQISDALEKETGEFIKNLKKHLSKYKRHPKIDTEWFENQIIAETQRLRNHLIEMKNSCPNYSIEDEINERVTALFDGKVGDDFDETKLKNIYSEGQKRYSEKIPPGYCDAKEKKERGNRHLYGDLILWKQIIQEASEKKCNVILVTDDVKEDWYERIKGKTIGPRKELIREFRDKTQMDILIYPCHCFLNYAKENMSVSVKQETISEVNEIHKEDETINNLISCNQSDNETVAKIFSEYPWMSTESIINSVIQSSIHHDGRIAGFTERYPDILSKDPFESITGLTGRYTDTLGKNPLESITGLTGRYTDTLGKNPLESITGLTGRYTDTLGKNSLESITGLTGRYTDILGKNSLESITGLTGRYTDTLGKNPLESITGLTGRYTDILGKNPLESIPGFTGRYLDILGMSPLETITGLTGRYTDMLGKDSLTGLTRRYTDKFVKPPLPNKNESSGIEENKG